jgi:hypothetical protein
MSLKTKLKRIFIAWDLFAAIICAVLYVFLLTTPVTAEIIKEITALVVSTLSIIFSVFFAALAVLITSGDNEFVKFLQKFGAYSEIIWSYKFTLLVIFIALLFSIILYITALFEIPKRVPGVYPLIIMTPYVFLTIYALFCTMSSAIDAIKYAEYRTKYLIAVNKENDKLDDVGNERN